jgi:ABC-type transporter Mla maintaining outer membrane lipid asymmetry permease subunit MlaE
MFVGISVFVQLTFLDGPLRSAGLGRPAVGAVVTSELGPVLIKLVVIVRCGSVMATEPSLLKIKVGICKLQATGDDPLLNPVMPRVLGMIASTFCLAVVFVLVALASGFLFVVWKGPGTHDVLLFADTEPGAVQFQDAVNILAKSILPALCAGASFCIGGLGVGGSHLDFADAIHQPEPTPTG